MFITVSDISSIISIEVGQLLDRLKFEKVGLEFALVEATAEAITDIALKERLEFLLIDDYYSHIYHLQYHSGGTELHSTQACKHKTHTGYYPDLPVLQDQRCRLYSLRSWFAPRSSVQTKLPDRDINICQRTYV